MLEASPRSPLKRRRRLLVVKGPLGASATTSPSPPAGCCPATGSAPSSCPVLELVLSFGEFLGAYLFLFIRPHLVIVSFLRLRYVVVFLSRLRGIVVSFSGPPPLDLLMTSFGKNHPGSLLVFLRRPPPLWSFCKDHPFGHDLLPVMTTSKSL